MLAQYNAKIAALKSADKSISDIEGIVSEISGSALSFGQKNALLKQIQDISFSKGIDLGARFEGTASDNAEADESNGHDIPRVDPALAKFTHSQNEDLKLNKVNETTLNEIKRGEAEQPLPKHFQNVSDLFAGPAKGWLAGYKRYYLFKIGRENSGAPKAILIHDNIPTPELLQRALDGFSETISLVSFLEQLEDEGSNVRRETHLCLLVLSDFSQKSYELIDKSDLLRNFDSFKYYELIFEGERVRTYEYEGDRLLADLQSDVHVSLTNASLDKAEESLIKSFFPPKPSLIQYKILKGGFSGSKVVEVCQAFSVPRPCKFIIKIGAKKDKKISQEELAVKQWVSNLVSSYQTEKKENATHEALKYQFASLDGKRESSSFSQYFKSNPSADIRQLIEKLFSHEIFQAWEELQFRKEEAISIGTLYKEYLDQEEIQAAVKKIAFEKADADWRQFSSLLGAQLPYSVMKVCHGDLHSENVIIDDHKVFLIDFGMTANTHCFVDYATLEVSVRFKLTPSYFPTNELHKVDEHFLIAFDVTDAALSAKIENADLKKSYEVISKIRQVAIQKVRGNSHSYRSNEELELNYLISLFCITLRNIKYSDLNQKYAISFSRQLASRILSKLNVH